MKQTPFVALPAAEQDAVFAILRQAGVEPRSICISRLELVTAELGESATLTTVSGPGWYRTYPWSPAWLDAFTRDLRAAQAPGRTARHEGLGKPPVAS